MSNNHLKFGFGNSKLGREIATFSIPSGYSCPGAHACLTKADPDTGTITDGPSAEFRCFSATAESAFRPVRAQRWHNFQILSTAKTRLKIKEVILETVPRYVKAVRIHVAGDFFSQDYFDAWMDVAREIPTVHFYAYTKSLKFWVKRIDEIPENFALIASRGGKFDSLIDEYQLPQAVVVMHPEAAEALGLQIDHDDSLAMAGKSLALLIHSTQKKGSPAQAAIKRLKEENITYSYVRRS